MHCKRFLQPPLTRREMLWRCASGFGAVALASLLAERAAGAGQSPFAPRPAHHRPRARNVIFLYMDGGVSQVDSFDPKPRLEREHGKPFAARMEPTQFDNIGSTLKSPWEFRRYGESGIPVSDLFPRIGECIDDIAVIRSMVSGFSEHTQANYFLHSGFGMQGRPSMGAWVSYGLGTECQDLPAFVVLNGGLIPSGGVDCFGSGFLPAAHQGMLFKPSARPVANVEPREMIPSLQRRKLALMRRLDEGLLERLGRADPLESAIANYEMAFRMQTAVPGLVDLQGEVEIHDLHATMLHLLGVDHQRLTFRFNGRDMRLTDVHGEIIREVLA